MTGLREVVLAAIKNDWAELSMDPSLVADRVARVIGPVLGGPDEAPPQGQPWSAR